MQFSPNSRADRHTLLEPRLADRSAGGESIVHKAVGLHMTDTKMLGRYILDLLYHVSLSIKIRVQP